MLQVLLIKIFSSFCALGDLQALNQALPLVLVGTGMEPGQGLTGEAPQPSMALVALVALQLQVNCFPLLQLEPGSPLLSGCYCSHTDRLPQS